jgi:hypothetical protein
MAEDTRLRRRWRGGDGNALGSLRTLHRMRARLLEKVRRA